MITAEGNVVSAENSTVTNNKDDDPILDSEVQRKLQLPLFWGERMKKFLSSFGSKIWQLIHYPIGEKISLVTFISIILIIGSITFVFTMLKFRVNDSNVINSEKYGISSRIQEIKTKNDLYYKATKEERLIKWIVMFSDWSYALGGDYKQKQADCLGAANRNLQEWGLNIVLESIPLLVKRIENLADRGELKIRKEYKSILSGDIIIFKFGETNLHVGFVYDLPNNYVRYYDFNVDTQTWDLCKMKWGNPNIWLISEISYSLSLGNLMQEFNKK